MTTTPPTTDDTKAREIHARLDKLAPYPTEGDVTARGLARYLAKQARIGWARGLSGPVPPSRAEVSRMVTEFACAHALSAFADRDSDDADQVAAQIRDAWEDGGGVGEWIWDLLGSDAKEIDELAHELAGVTR